MPCLVEQERARLDKEIAAFHHGKVKRKAIIDDLHSFIALANDTLAMYRDSEPDAGDDRDVAMVHRQLQWAKQQIAEVAK